MSHLFLSGSLNGDIGSGTKQFKNAVFSGSVGCKHLTSSGNVAIGKTSASTALDVAGSITSSGAVKCATIAPVSGDLTVTSGRLAFGGRTSNRLVTFQDDASSDHAFTGLGLTSAGMRYQVRDGTTDHVFNAGVSTAASKELVRFTGGGNVGVGTNVPGYKLDVAGKVGCQGVTVGASYLIPTADGELASKSYVDNVVSGLNPKNSVRVRSTLSWTTSSLATGSQLRVNFNVDGTTKVASISKYGSGALDGNPTFFDSPLTPLVVGDRLLVMSFTDLETPYNGIYVVAQATSPWMLTRAPDCDGNPGTEVAAGLYVFVLEGTVYKTTGWICIPSTPGLVTINTTGLSFTQFTSASAFSTADDGTGGVGVTNGTVGTVHHFKKLASTNAAITIAANTTTDVGVINVGFDPTQLPAASDTVAGVVTTGAQTFAGDKTFIGSI